MKRAEFFRDLRDLFVDAFILTDDAVSCLGDDDLLASYNLCPRCEGPGVNPKELDKFIQKASSSKEVFELVADHEDEAHLFEFEAPKEILLTLKEAGVDPEEFAATLVEQLLAKNRSLVAGKATLSNGIFVHYYFDAECVTGKPSVSFVTEEEYTDLLGGSEEVFDEDEEDSDVLPIFQGKKSEDFH